jgi:hypothetical protein
MQGSSKAQISGEAGKDYRGGPAGRLGWTARSLGLRGTEGRQDSNVAVLPRPVVSTLAAILFG